MTTYLHSTTGRANLVTGVRNGLGAVTDITYESLSTTDSYVRIAKLHSTPAAERCFDWQPGPGVYWLGLAGGGGGGDGAGEPDLDEPGARVHCRARVHRP